MREGLPLPDKIANAPVVTLGLQLYWVAFMELNSCRGIGMGPGPIPWTAIREYCLEFRLDEDQAEDMFFIIRQLDNSYLLHNEKKSKSESGKSRGRSKGGRGVDNQHS